MVRALKLYSLASAFCLALSALFATLALAEPGASVYSTIDIEGNCRLVRQYENNMGGQWRCPGFDGGPELLVAEGDLRYFLGYGLRAKKQISFGQTLGP